MQVLSVDIGIEYLYKACLYVAGAQLKCNDGFFIASPVVSCMACY